MRANFLILVLLAAIPASADVIHLKNGRTIWADQVRENKDRIEYDLGEDTYAIPKSSVDHIDAGGVAPVHSGSGLRQSPRHHPTRAHIQPRSRRRSEKSFATAKLIPTPCQPRTSGNAEVAATAYFLAGKHESDRGNFPQAKRYYESALRFQPDNATLLIYYAATADADRPCSRRL